MHGKDFKQEVLGQAAWAHSSADSQGSHRSVLFCVLGLGLCPHLTALLQVHTNQSSESTQRVPDPQRIAKGEL